MRSTRTKRALDPAATRSAILDSATKHFAESGFAATSLNRIAQAAGVPKSLVLYHFESKEGLWNAVFQAKGQLIYQVAQAIIDGDPSVTILDLVRAKFRTLQQNPDLVRLMGWMSLENREPNPEIAIRAKKVREVIRSQPERFQSPPGLEPDKYVVILLTAVDGFFRFRNVYERIMACPMTSTESEEEFLANLLALSGPTTQNPAYGL